MRIHAMPLPQAHSKHTSSVNASQASPGATFEKVSATAATSGSNTESVAVPANTAGNPGKPESKLTPAGLLAAQLRFQSMSSEEMNKGQARAMEVINRNIERYQSHHGIAPQTPVTDTTAATEPATGTELAGNTGTTSTPPSTAATAPATGETDATPAADQTAVA